MHTGGSTKSTCAIIELPWNCALGMRDRETVVAPPNQTSVWGPHPHASSSGVDPLTKHLAGFQGDSSPGFVWFPNKWGILTLSLPGPTETWYCEIDSAGGFPWLFCVVGA
jgi:hypothetical protein